MTDDRSEREANRILAEYERRSLELPGDFYSVLKAPNLFLRQNLERALLWGLKLARTLPLESQRVLDIGCGTGDLIGILLGFGCRAANISAIELDPERAGICARRFPGVDVHVGNAAELPWARSSFDIVLQSTVFTSILDAELKRRLGQEMIRVMAPNGVILWYDFVYNNPSNPNVRGVSRREVKALFSPLDCKFKTVTLAPPLARRIVPVSWILASMLESLKVFDTHCLAVIRPRDNDS